MNKDITRVFVKPYTWYTDAEAINGMAIMYGTKFQCFIPYSETERLMQQMKHLLENQNK